MGFLKRKNGKRRFDEKKRISEEDLIGYLKIRRWRIPEEKMLKNIVDYVAAESMELINYITTVSGEATVKAVLNIPSTINHKQYWLRLNTNSKYAFVEAGFGTIPTQAHYKLYLLTDVSASGEIIGGFGKALLTCQRTDSGIYLSLDYLEG